MRHYLNLATNVGIWLVRWIIILAFICGLCYVASYFREVSESQELSVWEFPTFRRYILDPLLIVLLLALAVGCMIVCGFIVSKIKYKDVG